MARKGDWKCETYFLATSRFFRAPASGASTALLPLGFNHFASGSAAASPCSINWTWRAMTSRSNGWLRKPGSMASVWSAPAPITCTEPRERGCASMRTTVM